VTRTLRIILAAGALVLLVVATAIAAPSDRGRERMAPVAASHQPASPGAQDEPANDDEELDEDGIPSQQLLDRLVAKLDDAGVSTDADAIAALAADYGVGGAVRLLWWASAAGVSADEIAAMFDSGMGWGEIAQELNAGDEELDLHPGLGTIMGNGGGPPDGAQGLGLGRTGAPGQQKRQ
jgi:hypothetical protein